MHRLHLREFRGMRPRRASRIKGASYAESAVDVKLWDGRLRNFPCPTVCGSASSVRTITPQPSCGCLTWPTEVSITNDCDLQFITGDGVPKISSNVCTGDETNWIVGNPSTPSVSATCDTADVRYVAYMYAPVKTVHGRDFQYQVSQPTNWVPACGTVTVSGLSASGASKYRVYRAESGFHTGEDADVPTNATWVYAGETGASTFADDISTPDAQMKPPLLFEYGAPPADLRELGQTDSGVMVGLSGNALAYTLPGQPTTWSGKRCRIIRSDWGTPKKLVVHGEDAYVLTDRFIVHYRVQLSEAGPVLQRQVIHKHLPIVSNASLSVGHRGIFYASTNGLVAVANGQASIVSSPWFNQDDWRKLDPESVAGTVHEDAYIFSTSVDAFLMEFGDDLYADNELSDLVALDLNGTIKGATAMASTDKVYWHVNGTTYSWDRSYMPNAHHHTDDVVNLECCPLFYRTSIEDDNMSRTYTNAELHIKAGSSFTFTYGRIECDGRRPIRTKQVEDCKPFKLPACRRPEDTYVDIEGCGVVDSLTLATSATGLRSTRG